jgi:hypothetical protein
MAQSNNNRTRQTRFAGALRTLLFSTFKISTSTATANFQTHGADSLTHQERSIDMDDPTPSEYGPLYTTFTDAELDTAIDNRGDVKNVTPWMDREWMIRILREADRKATFRFLDLPPELRNRVYEELFTFKPSKWHSESKHCHPAILATSKEVNKEANEYLNDEREAEICITLRHRDLRAPTELWRELYGLDVKFNGTAIVSTTIPIYWRNRRDAHNINIKWPALLRRVRSISLKIDLCPVNQDHILFLGSWGGREVNHSLHQLYTFLHEGCQAKALKIDITSALASEFGLPNALSPMCALAGRFRDAAFNMDGLSFNLQTELKDDTAAFRKLHALVDDVAGRHDTDPTAYYHLATELERCEKLVTPRCWEMMYSYADSETVQAAVVEFEAAIKEKANKKLDELPPHIIAAIRRIQENRAARSVKAEKAEQEQQKGESHSTMGVVQVAQSMQLS